MFERFQFNYRHCKLYYRMFNTTTNCIQSRVTKMYSAALQAEKASLATHYGAIVGLQELGSEVTAPCGLHSVILRQYFLVKRY